MPIFPRSALLLAVAVACLDLSLLAQTSTEIDNFTAVTPVLSVDMYNGTGINVNPGDPAQFALAANIGMKYVRFDCPWNTIESASNPGTYSFAGTTCLTGLQAAKTNGQTAYVNALYGPAVTQLGTATTTAAVSTGALSVPVSSVRYHRRCWQAAKS